GALWERRQRAKPPDRRDGGRRIARCVVDEPEQDCDCQLNPDGRRPALLLRQAVPARAKLVPKADLLRDLAAPADVRLGLGQLAAFWCSLAEEPLGPEDENQDQDREDDRLRPVGTGRVPAEA